MLTMCQILKWIFEQNAWLRPSETVCTISIEMEDQAKWLVLLWSKQKSKHGLLIFWHNTHTCPVYFWKLHFMMEDFYLERLLRRHWRNSGMPRKSPTMFPMLTRDGSNTYEGKSWKVNYELYNCQEISSIKVCRVQ